MKKQVKSVLVAISNNDTELFFYPKEYYDIKEGELVFEEFNPYGCGEPRQLLILDESAEIKEGEPHHTWYNNKLQVTQHDKIIASHPTIQGTLPISKSFLEEFCNRPYAKVYMNTEESYNGDRLIECDLKGAIKLTLENEEVKEEVQEIDISKPICYWGNWGVDEFIEKVDTGYRLYSTVYGEKSAETFIDEPTAKALYETLGKLLNTHSQNSK